MYWRLVVGPERDGDWTTHLPWLTVAQARRWHAPYHTTGTGPLDQGRFQSLPLQEGDHVLAGCRYAERNPRRADLVPQAEAWRWPSLWHGVRQTGAPWRTPWPVAVPDDWAALVNRPPDGRRLGRAAVVGGAWGAVRRQRLATTHGEVPGVGINCTVTTSVRHPP